MCSEKRVMEKGEDVEKAVQRRHRRPSFFSLFFCFSFLVLRALSWRREAAPLVYRQGTSNSQMAFLFPFLGVTLAVVVDII
jgi:hypothetical protein